MPEKKANTIPKDKIKRTKFIVSRGLDFSSNKAVFSKNRELIEIEIENIKSADITAVKYFVERTSDFPLGFCGSFISVIWLICSIAPPKDVFEHIPDRPAEVRLHA